MMGMSSWILDLEEKFWDRAQEIVGDCKTWKEFLIKMTKDDSFYCVADLKDLKKFWDDYWS
jgi:hypothetical protein